MFISAYTLEMSRAATTTDAFNAIAESSRRDILNALIGGEVSVNDLVEQLPLTQPQVSKHLGVLRTVDLVRCRTVGRQRLYSVNAPALKPIHDWLGAFENLWNQRFDRLDDYLATLQTEETTP
jgi:DNA-binding transcriptional ArsR family regulator